MTADGARARVGITCPADHPVFGAVGDRLVERGHEVTYLDPTVDVDRGTLAALDLLVVKQTRPASVRAAIAAERLGVPTWNSATGVVACVSRLTQLCLLEGVGFAVPAASPTPPAGDYVAKGRYHWQQSPELNGEGDVYEALLPTDSIDHKYYLVHDGAAYRTCVLRATSKLWGEKRVLGEAEPVPEHVERITRLMERLGMRAIGVDLVRAEDGWYAVDLNPCPSFVGTDFEDALVASIDSCLG